MSAGYDTPPQINNYNETPAGFDFQPAEPEKLPYTVQAYGEVVAKRGKPQERSGDVIYTDEESGLFIVNDGMGGHKNEYGDDHDAAEWARDKIVETLKPMPKIMTAEEAKAAVGAAQQIAHRTIRRKDPNHEIGSANATLWFFQTPEGERMAVVAHSGDSRIYLRRTDDSGRVRIHCLTVDHGSVVYRLPNVPGNKPFYDPAKMRILSDDELRTYQETISEFKGDPNKHQKPEEVLEAVNAALRDKLSKHQPYMQFESYEQYQKIRARIGGQLGGQDIQAHATIDTIVVKPGDEFLMLSDAAVDNHKQSEIEAVWNYYKGDPAQTVGHLRKSTDARSQKGVFGSKPDDFSGIGARVAA